MAGIEIERFSKRFGAVAAVDDLSFTAREGAVTGFLGPNGAGKTTTLRMLLGLVKPSSGTATFNGVRYRDLEDPSRHVGAVLETTGFYPGRRARDHLGVLAVASGVPPQRVDQVLTEVGLNEAGARRVKEISLGMRQRLGLAAAILGNPEVLILDEPANGLDPEGVHWLRNFLRSIRRQGWHRARLEPPPGRNSADGRRRCDPRSRTTRRPVVPRRVGTPSIPRRTRTHAPQPAAARSTPGTGHPGRSLATRPGGRMGDESRDCRDGRCGCGSDDLRDDTPTIRLGGTLSPTH